MIGLLQRVSEASVSVEAETIAAIGPGLLVFIGVVREDTQADVTRLADRLLHYRVFADDSGRMNRSLLEVDGEILLVPQFTLAADTHKGTRAGFSRAADPRAGESLFDQLVREVRLSCKRVQTGQFGAHMLVHLINDGPVTFRLATR